MDASLFTCRKCGQEKPVSEYYRNKQNKRGHFHECKACHRAAVKARYSPHPRTKREKPARIRRDATKNTNCGTAQSRAIECAVIRHRILADHPETYSAIASRFGVTRQRVHQIAQGIA